MTVPTDLVSKKRRDCGLLVLRCAAVFLLLTIGWEKFRDLALAIRDGKVATTGLAPLMRKMGLPFPSFILTYVSLMESVGALLIGIGFYTRLLALCCAMSMAGAFYTSAHFGWEPVRAFIYMFFFAALVFTGPGRLSLDARLSKGMPTEVSTLDVGLLILRLGLLLSFVFMFTLKGGNAATAFALGPSRLLVAGAALLAVPVILGYFTRPAAILSSIVWAAAAVIGLVTRQHWDLLPYRDVLLVFLFVTLSLTGPGKYSLQRSRA